MNPFYFGNSEKPLFGIHEPPRQGIPRAESVILCYPHASELVTSHRPFRQIAELLADRGYHVLRFDYCGSGDSHGEARDGNLTEWLSNVDTAIEELENLGGTPRVALVGLRLGAAIATLTAARRRDVSTLVLWDPVVKGREYLDELTEAHEHFVKAWHDARPPKPTEGEIEVLGYTLSRRLCEELIALDLNCIQRIAVDRLAIVVSKESESILQLREHLERINGACKYDCVQGAGEWSGSGDLGIKPLAPAVLRSVVRGLGD